MVKIAPSILAADFNNLEKEVVLISKTNCEYIHCDVMDGNFVPNISFGPDIIKKINKNTNKVIDVHLMIKNVLPNIKVYKDAGADIITFHYEAEKKHLEIIKKIRKLNVKVGLAIKPNTSLKFVKDYLKYIDIILIMTVEPGFGGQKFINNQLRIIGNIRNSIDKQNLNTLIEVDGGINKITGKKCVSVGADILVAGTYIFKDKNKKYNEKINSLR